MKLNKTHITLTVLLPIWYGLVQLASNHSQFIETYYSNGIYPYIAGFLRVFWGWIPFSVGDVVVLTLIFFILKGIIVTIINKFSNLIAQVLKLTTTISVIYFCFYFFWGFNYFREPLAKKLGYTTSTYTTEKLITTTQLIIKKLNALQLSITNNDTVKVTIPYTKQEIYATAIASYKNLNPKYGFFSYTTPSVKNALISKLQCYTQTLGYLNPITGEAQINAYIPKTSLATTVCHEIAHQIGYAAENEANFIGFLAAASSNNIHSKYTAYKMALGYCMTELNKRNKTMYKQLWKDVNKSIIKDFNANYVFWKQYKNPLEPIVKKGYNAYLKANKQDKGIASYNYVVDLLILYLNN